MVAVSEAITSSSRVIRSRDSGVGAGVVPGVVVEHGERGVFVERVRGHHADRTMIFTAPPFAHAEAG